MKHKSLTKSITYTDFKKGDHRSGYYRDQTFMLAINEITVQQIFSALYANTNLNKEPMSGGRQMGSHFMTNYLDKKGNKRLAKLLFD